jgi:hypothetical protein
MEVHEGEKVHQQRNNQDKAFSETYESKRPIQPHRITKPNDPDTLDLYRYHSDKTWKEFDEWMANKGFNVKHALDEIWIQR